MDWQPSAKPKLYVSGAQDWDTLAPIHENIDQNYEIVNMSQTLQSSQWNETDQRYDFKLDKRFFDSPEAHQEAEQILQQVTQQVLQQHPEMRNVFQPEHVVSYIKAMQDARQPGQSILTPKVLVSCPSMAHLYNQIGHSMGGNAIATSPSQMTQEHNYLTHKPKKSQVQQATQSTQTYEAGVDGQINDYRRGRARAEQMLPAAQQDFNQRKAQQQQRPNRDLGDM